jgi:hypothetical protein
MKSIRFTLILFLLISMIHPALAQADTPRLLDEIIVEVPGLTPEGIEYDSVTDRFLLSSMGFGTIYAVTTEGEVSPFIQDDDLTATGGIHIDMPNRRLIVANIDSQAVAQLFTGSIPEQTGAAVAAYDLDTGERIYFADLSPLEGVAVHAANDVTVDLEGNAYVTNSFAPVIYKITPEGEASIFIQNDRLAHPVFGLNGIDFHPDGYLLAAMSGSGALLKIPLDAPEEITEVSLNEAFGADGIYLSPEGTLYAVAVVFEDSDTQLNLQAPDLQLIQVESEDDWNSAAITASTPLPAGATTVTLRDGQPYVINAHLAESFAGEIPPQYEILGFQLVQSEE